MSGSLTQIISNNNENSPIVFKDSNITFFKIVFHKYVNFSIEHNIQTFFTKPKLSNQINIIQIKKKGDYLNKMILKLKLKAESTNSGNFAFIYNLGLSIIKNVQLKIGNTIIDEIYGNWLIIWKELFNDNSAKKILNKLVGNTVENLKYNNKTKICDLYIPIPFFYDNNLSLPLTSLIHDDIELLFKFRNEDELIIKQDNTFEDIKYRDFLYSLASDSITDFESSYQSQYKVTHGYTDSAYESRYDSIYELFNPKIYTDISINKSYDDEEFIILDDVINIGESTDYNEHCIDNISIEEAKTICKSVDNNYNAFYAINKNGVDKVCFKHIYNFNERNNLSITKTTLGTNINSAFFILKIKKTYDVTLEIIDSESYLISDNIIIDKLNKNKLLYLANTLLLDCHYYQEENIPFNITKGIFKINSKFPTKFLSFVIQPNGLITGNKYLHIPGDNYFLNAGIRFCYRYANSLFGIFINESLTLDSSIYSNLYYNEFFPFIDSYCIKIGEPLIFKEHINNEYLDIFKNLFIKLNPILIAKSIVYTIDDDDITLKNLPKFYSNKIKININNLNSHDKFLLSLDCEELDKLYIPTTDKFNEGHPNYDYNIYDYSTFTTQLDRKSDNFFNEVSLELNNIPKMDYFNISMFNLLENYKFNMPSINGINIYSFSLHPRHYHPSGTCNFSVIDKYSFLFRLKDINNNIDPLIYNLENKIIKKNSKILFMSKYYNILTINNGMLTLKYV
tara:strand:+ start:1227 stop:3437 length:2211 start_codon:yes stop_codon:yes gene_type:complete